MVVEHRVCGQLDPALNQAIFLCQYYSNNMKYLAGRLQQQYGLTGRPGTKWLQLSCENGVRQASTEGNLLLVNLMGSLVCVEVESQLSR